MALNLPLYLGEDNGAKIVRVGPENSQVTTAGGTEQVLGSFECYAIAPAGAVGDVVFWGLSVTMGSSAGFSCTITPIIDGIEQAAVVFNAAVGGLKVCQVQLRRRGTYIGFRFNLTARPGWVDILASDAHFVSVRETP